MSLDKELSEEDKNRIYESYVEGEIDGHPYIKLVDKKFFFGADCIIHLDLLLFNYPVSTQLIRILKPVRSLYKLGD